jgi:hypothetical protein
MPNTAHIYKSKSGNWNMSFHHPICREGSIGKKIHRSLKVSEESEARRLERQINELLAIAHESPSSLPTRGNAREYDPVIVDAFFDCLTPEPVDYLGLRERAMEMPPRFRASGPVPRALLVGATGVGKSRLIQHILQTTHENFPMRGAGRTTVTDTEVIVDNVDFSAVITIYSENEIREVVKENIVEACSFAYKKEGDRKKIASKLLVDSDKRFRLSHVLGGWPQGAADQSSDYEDLDSEDSGIETDLAAGRSSLDWEKLPHYVDRVCLLAEDAQRIARKELGATSVDDEVVVDEYWLQYVDEERLDALTEEILEELEAKLCSATGSSKWPAIHRIPDTTDKAEFFRRLRPFYQNHRFLFGTLVTPLVQGIRVRGRFPGPPWAADAMPSWVLLDGQGVGHEQAASTKINRTLRPELTKKYSSADIICLVDRAMPAMTGDTPILLEDLITRGYAERVALVFTHFEAVSAPDLDLAGRKAKVLEGVSSAIQGIDSLPKAQKVVFERTAEMRAFFLARLDSNELAHKGTRAEFKRLCELIQASAIEAPSLDMRPVFNEYHFAEAVRKEIIAYRRDWSEAELSGHHWKVMEALTNWIGNAFSDGYPRRNLYPAQDLSRRLVSVVSMLLENPREWTPRNPGSLDEESRILNSIRMRAGEKIDAYCREAVVQDPRTGDWLPAYETISGPGTKKRRARAVARILEDHAQLPDEGLGGFTRDIWGVIQSTILEVCASSPPSSTNILET